MPDALVEEALDQVAIVVPEGTVSRDVAPARHRFDVRPRSPPGETLPQDIGIVGSLGEQDVAGLNRSEPVGGTAPVPECPPWRSGPQPPTAGAATTPCSASSRADSSGIVIV